MIRALKKISSLYHLENGRVIQGQHSGLTGDCTGLKGHLNLCGITQEDRDRCFDVSELIRN